jgi:hypothetical protein
MEQVLTIHVAPHPDNHTCLVFEDGHELAGEDLVIEPAGARAD